jgi:CRP-like cAMP-binding protein
MRWPLLDGIPEEELREILQVARRRTLSKGEVVFNRNDPADSCHLIVSGRFAVRIMTALGDTVTIALRAPAARLARWR